MVQGQHPPSIHPLKGMWVGSFYLSATSSEAGLHMLPHKILGERPFPFSGMNAKEYS